jgi:prohibitin 1
MFRGLFAGTAALVGGALYSCAFVVNPGDAAIMYSKLTGISHTVYQEGLNFRIPGLEEPRFINIRMRPRVFQTMTGTKDLQTVMVGLRILFLTQEVLKAVIAEYNAEEIIREREAVSNRVRDLLNAKSKEFNVIFEDISLMHIEFTKEFMQAVEVKQVAYQEAERFKFVVLENEQKTKASIIRAEGEAAAAKMVSEAIHLAGSGLVELRRIESSKEIATELLSSGNVSFVPRGAGLLLNPGNFQTQGGASFPVTAKA